MCVRAKTPSEQERVYSFPLLLPLELWVTSNEVTSTRFSPLQLWVISDNVTSATVSPFFPGGYLD